MLVPEINAFLNNPPAPQADAFEKKRVNLPPGVVVKVLAYTPETAGFHHVGNPAYSPPFPNDADITNLCRMMAAMVMMYGPGAVELNMLVVDNTGDVSALSVPQRGLGRPFIMPDINGWSSFRNDVSFRNSIETTASIVENKMRREGAINDIEGKLSRYAFHGLNNKHPNMVVSTQLVAFFTPDSSGEREPITTTYMVALYDSPQARILADWEGDRLVGHRNPVPVKSMAAIISEVNAKANVLAYKQHNFNAEVNAGLGLPRTVCNFAHAINQNSRCR